MIPDGPFAPVRSPRKRAAAAAALVFALLLLAAGSVFAAAGCSGGSTRLGRNRAPEATLTVTGAEPVAPGVGEMLPADDAMPLVQAPAGASIVVTCHAQDKDGDPLTYAWKGSGVTTTPADANTNVATFTQATETTTLITCAVSDDRGGVTAQAIRVKTFDAGTNHAPELTFTVAPGSVAPGAALPLAAAAVDRDNDKITFTFLASRGVVKQDAADPSRAVFTAPAETGDVTIAAIATDAKKASSAQLAVVTVR